MLCHPQKRMNTRLLLRNLISVRVPEAMGVEEHTSLDWLKISEPQSIDEVCMGARGSSLTYPS